MRGFFISSLSDLFFGLYLSQLIFNNDDKATMDYTKIITIDPEIRSGKPCIRGMRITVTDVLEYLASGMSVDEILEDFPDLTREDIMASLAFAAERR